MAICGFDSSWHRRMGLFWLICNMGKHIGQVLSVHKCLSSLHTDAIVIYRENGYILSYWPVRPLFVFCIKLGLNHLDLFLLVLLPLLLNWKTQVLLNIFHKSFLCHCWYLNWLVILTSLTWSKSGTQTISTSWMNVAGLIRDKFLGTSASEVKFEELVTGSSLQRIANSISYLREALSKTVLNNLFTIWTTCSHQTAIGVLNFHWVLKLEIRWIVLFHSRDLKCFLSYRIVPIITTILGWLHLKNKLRLLFVFSVWIRDPFFSRLFLQTSHY